MHAVPPRAPCATQAKRALNAPATRAGLPPAWPSAACTHPTPKGDHTRAVPPHTPCATTQSQACAQCSRNARRPAPQPGLLRPGVPHAPHHAQQPRGTLACGAARRGVCVGGRADGRGLHGHHPPGHGGGAAGVWGGVRACGEAGGCVHARSRVLPSGVVLGGCTLVWAYNVPSGGCSCSCLLLAGSCAQVAGVAARGCSLLRHALALPPLPGPLPLPMCMWCLPSVCALPPALGAGIAGMAGEAGRFLVSVRSPKGRHLAISLAAAGQATMG